MINFVSNFATLADERQSSSSKQAQEYVSKFTSELASEKGGVTANDIDAAKVAAMKAAELGIVLSSRLHLALLGF